MLEFLLGAFILIGGLVSVGSVIAMIGSETKKQDLMCIVFAVCGLVVAYVASSRLLCAKNGNFDKVESSAVAYAWFIWEKGYCGDTVIKWFN